MVPPAAGRRAAAGSPRRRRHRAGRWPPRPCCSPGELAQLPDLLMPGVLVLLARWDNCARRAAACAAADRDGVARLWSGSGVPASAVPARRCTARSSCCTRSRCCPAGPDPAAIRQISGTPSPPRMWRDSTGGAGTVGRRAPGVFIMPWTTGSPRAALTDARSSSARCSRSRWAASTLPRPPNGTGASSGAVHPERDRRRGAGGRRARAATAASAAGACWPCCSWRARCCRWCSR
ncbi:hypothetical protein HBB16_16835 [Pseudonocardia sp. MCCB 268]|nr:hypothetical protein [Pseudonocardia cytotoxica]